MVVRLEGKVQGQDVIFNRVQGDEWETIIPPSLNGVYIVELKAYDDAGNMSYTARYILTVDLTSIHAKVNINRIEAKVRMSRFFSEPRVSHYHSKIQLSRYYSRNYLSPYYAKVRCCTC